MLDLRQICRWSSSLTLAGCGLTILAWPGQVSASEERTGEQIYKQQCVECHGKNGEGSEEYPHVLAGDKPVVELTRLIAKTMPKGSAGDCVGKDAEKVARYLYDAFYSPTAQARNKPPRIELARLTVRQYRHALADLVGSFRTPVQLDGERGLRGEYFKSKRFRGGERLIDRRDATVQFNFKDTSPEPGKIEPAEFGIRWQGSLLAPETGEYELIVKTENGARLWLNDNDRPLIDAWVKSGSDTEYRGSIRLLGGRAYPLRLEFFKSKEKSASIELAWKLPQRTDEAIPERCLSPHSAPETFVSTAPFPPDDRSVGYERGTSVSKAWEQATTDAAIEAAGYIVPNLDELAGLRGGDREAKLRDFCRLFAERAFRRTLSEEQSKIYLDQQFAEAPDAETAVKRVLLLVLKSPRLLYREFGAGNDSYDVAARLSFGLWDSLPDAPLLEAAAAGQLATRGQAAQQAERMAADPRARAKLREFFLQWLKVEQIPDLAKDPERFPEFDAAIASDLRTSLELTLDEIIASPSCDFRQILLADSLYLNGRLAKFYGAELPADAAFQKVSLEPGERAGVLSHPYLLANFAYTATSSPIHRGVFIARSLLGRSLRPPPEAVAPLAPALHADLSTRQRVALQTSPQACQLCHDMINPLGYALERFDAVGRYRKEEQGRAIDARGAYQTRTGDLAKFDGVRDLAAFLVRSEETHSAVVEQLFQHLIKQPIQAYGPGQLPELRKSFAEHDFNLRRLMVEIVSSAAVHSAAEKSAPEKSSAAEKK